MEKSGKETAENMEYLLELLHTEWERSGRTRAEALLGPADRQEVGARLTEEIQERQKQLDAEGMGFRECLGISRENFILLRLARKIKKAVDRAGLREDAVSFAFEMDREELRLFSTLLREPGE